MVDYANNDLSASFRQKSSYMKTWQPASTPSVRYFICYKMLRCVVYGEWGKRKAENKLINVGFRMLLLYSIWNEKRILSCSNHVSHSFSYVPTTNRTEIAWNYMPYTNKLYPEMLQHL